MHASTENPNTPFVEKVYTDAWFALLQACVPYFEILEKWIYKGIIVDPYCEVIFSVPAVPRKTFALSILVHDCC